MSVFLDQAPLLKISWLCHWHWEAWLEFFMLICACDFGTNKQTGRGKYFLSWGALHSEF